MDTLNKERKNQNPHCSRADGFPFMGFVFVGLGLVFLLDRMNLIPDYWRSIIISWQALLIFIGLINIFRNNHRFPGFILILVGATFLIPDVFNIPFETRQLIWPVLLIIIGLAILFKTKRSNHPDFFRSHSNGDSINNADFIDEVAIFGGGKRIVTSKNLKGGKVTAIFGGLELDLTQAEISEDVAIIEISAVFGGATIFVNPDWVVQVQVASVMGGFSDKRKSYKQEGVFPHKTLIIKGAAVFGGGEVK